MKKIEYSQIVRKKLNQLKADFKIILEKQIWLRYHKNKVGKKKEVRNLVIAGLEQIKEEMCLHN